MRTWFLVELLKVSFFFFLFSSVRSIRECAIDGMCDRCVMYELFVNK